MVKINPTRYQGYQAVEVSNGDISLAATVSVGPRVLKCTAFGSENLFAELPDAALDYPGEGSLRLIGGHRLWYAPEKPETTYIPDDNPVEWREIENGIELIQPVDRPTGIMKSFTVQLSASGAKATISHKLRNTGEKPFTLAPWAITQMRAGGTAVIPQPTEPADPNGLLPNRNIVLWTYTDLAAGFVVLKNEGLYVHARVADDSALKIGSSNPIGWIGYSLEGMLFVKHAGYISGGDYLDKGASSQIYTNQSFLEIETLAPISVLASGESASHQEVWEIFPEGHWPAEYKKYFG